jgi:hypothetical protein
LRHKQTQASVNREIVQFIAKYRIADDSPATIETARKVFNLQWYAWEIVSTELANVDEDVSTAARALTGNERRVRWLELSLVLVIAFGGSFLSSLYVMKAGKAGLPMISEFRWARGFVQEIPCLFLLGYILSRRRKSFRDIGLRWSVRDLAVGLGLTLVSYLAYIIGGASSFTRYTGLSSRRGRAG